MIIYAVCRLRYNSQVRLIAIAGLLVLLLSLAGCGRGQPPVATGRSIGVSTEGTGSSTVIIVNGTGFTPNSRVVIRLTDKQLVQLQFAETAEGNGKFVSRHGVVCNSGAEITVTAFEDANPTSTFANSVARSCP